MAEETEPNGVNEPGAATRYASKRLEIIERRKQVATLLLNRTPQRDIAKALNVSAATVSGDVTAVKKEWMQESQAAIEGHIAHELAAMNADERMLRGRLIATNDTDGKLRVYDRILKLMEQRRKLLGLDAPLRLELARAEAMKLAKEYDLDPDELLALAEQIVMDAQQP